MSYKNEVLFVRPDELRPNSYNVNVMSPDNERKLEGSIDRFDGLFKPILVRQAKGKPGYEILGGEHRWHIAKRKGLTSVPIWNLGEIDDRRAKEISIADNARYGADDALSLSELLKELDATGQDIQTYLPYTDIDIDSLFSSSDIALNDLDLEETSDHEEAPIEPPMARAPKTHTMMRFKVPIEDAEKITEIIARTQTNYGYTAADQATNAGDALVHLLLGGGLGETEW